MTPDEARQVIITVIGEIAPEIDVGALDPALPLADQVEIDSMDQLNVMIGIHEATGIELPEQDYPKLRSIDSVVAYLTQTAANG